MVDREKIQNYIGIPSPGAVAKAQCGGIVSNTVASRFRFSGMGINRKSKNPREMGEGKGLVHRIAQPAKVPRIPGAGQWSVVLLDAASAHSGEGTVRLANAHAAESAQSRRCSRLPARRRRQEDPGTRAPN